MSKIDTSWSRLIDSDMGDYVMDNINDPRLRYHNGNHVRRLYAKANEWGLKYDPNLDAAILWHDAVYDSATDKEVRSAELMNKTAELMPDWFESVYLDPTTEMILSTISHNVSTAKNSLMIKLDLAELGDPELCKVNFWDIQEEGIALSSGELDRTDVATNTIKFMTHFKIILQDNAALEYDDDKFDGDGNQFWTAVINGADTTILMAETMIKTLEITS
jgi:hypothetical protein